MPSFTVSSPNVRYTEEHIQSKYIYETSKVHKDGKNYTVIPEKTEYTFCTERTVPKLGVMLVGWGGNNGSTITAGILSNKLGLTWNTKEGLKRANYKGSLTQASTVCLGSGPDGDVYIPLKDLLPMVHPDDLVIDGWDISSLDIAQSMERAQVLDWNLQQKLRPYLENMKPRPSIYCSDFIAANQADRADNVLSGTKQQMMEKIREDIRDFKKKNNLDKVIILWTANTERFCDVQQGLNDTADSLLDSIRRNEEEVSPSSIFAVASILEHCSYINGSPQNTFVPGVVELAQKYGTFLAGDDFKSGQTKMKSVLVDFLVGAGIKPVSIVSYNHLGNNDGKNLSAPKQFRSKEISKSNVVDDVVASNDVLYEKGEKPDHCVVIKYVPYVADSKRAMDEYTSEIFMNGTNTIVLHNTCEDSLLAAPIILDLVILCEMCERITFTVGESTEFQSFHPVLSILSYLLKAPMVPSGTPVVNALFKQRACIENIFRACVGLAPENHMLLEAKQAQQQKQQEDLKQPSTKCIKLDDSALSNGKLTNGYINGHIEKSTTQNVMNGFATNGTYCMH